MSKNKSWGEIDYLWVMVIFAYLFIVFTFNFLDNQNKRIRNLEDSINFSAVKEQINCSKEIIYEKLSFDRDACLSLNNGMASIHKYLAINGHWSCYNLKEIEVCE